jgi:hypothetical protein
MRRKFGILTVLVALGVIFPVLGTRSVHADTCIAYGQVCDTRYVPPAPCCTGSCYSPYPGVPKFCL